jgi:predicted DNA-binding transcriptional regulator YafY
MARHFEISRRQAMRDIEYLRDSLGAPLEYSAEQKGYFYREDTYVLPSLIISESEIRTLSYLATEYSRSGAEMGEKLALLFQRIAGRRDQTKEGGAAGDDRSRDIPVVPLEPAERDIYSAISEAIADRHVIEFSYINTQRLASRRAVSPYKIFRKSSIHYMVGYCSHKRAIRVFRLGRISDVRRIDASFYMDPGFREEKYGEKEPFDFALPYKARIVMPAPLHPAILKHSFTSLSDGSLEVEFKDPSRLITALMGLDSGFKILKPSWLRERLEKKIASIAKNNFQWDILCHTPSNKLSPSQIKEGEMAKRLVENAAMGHTWTSYVAAAEGCLRASRFWSGETWKLMGRSGMGFHFIVHREICPSSVTVYDWNSEHVDCMDRMGIISEAFSMMDDGRHNTFADARERAVQKIKESIERGIPALVWAPTPILEFGVINGFDDADGVFSVEQCTGQPADPLLYGNLGKSEVPILFYQIFYKKASVDEPQIIRRSLEFGLSEWKKENHVNPENYASGIKGYANLIGALEKGVFNEFGLGYLAAVYTDSKTALTQYLNWLAARPDATKPLAKAAKHFAKVSDAWAGMAKLAPFSGVNGRRESPLDKETIPEILKLAKEAFAREKEAMEEISTALQR